MDKAFDRLDHAFAISERHLGIERLLDPEGINSHIYIYIYFCCARRNKHKLLILLTA